MPKGIFTQFIVAVNELIIEASSVWRKGVVLEKDQTKAEIIKHYGRNEITIRVVGKKKRRLLTIVSYELDAIHKSYKQLRPVKWIPCNCVICKDSQNPHLYPFDVLQRFIASSNELI